MAEPKKQCPECVTFQTILIRGIGRDAQFMVCPLWREPGHLTEDEIREKLAQIRQRLNPSGRMA
jgi:hypothetical protein